MLLVSVPVQLYAVCSKTVPFLDPYHWEGVMFFCLVVELVLMPTAFVVNQSLQWLGQISFSIYLIHSPLIAIFFPLFKYLQQSNINPSSAYLTAFGLTLLCVIPLAVLTHKIVEKPANRLGRRFAK